MDRARAALAGCAQGVGEHCQLHDDCAAGLACVLPVTRMCPDWFPGCPPCFAGGTCQPESATDRRCGSDGDCAAGLRCLESPVCTERRASVCTAAADLGVSADLAETD
ncbi:MAG TPA: hypothetical protein VFF06_08670 [Polyangia bacterium]|nr:hypothetical protein [Polyangia bacterium]